MPHVITTIKRLCWMVLAIFVMLGGLPSASHGRAEAIHKFSDADCRVCHENPLPTKTAGRLKPDLNAVCRGCHTEHLQPLSHPLDIHPVSAIPADLPLERGKLGCITCHHVHPSSAGAQPNRQALLRRPGRRKRFCATCHRLDERRHFIFENAHLGSKRETEHFGSLDDYTLQCVECHDKQLSEHGASGLARWKRFTPAQFHHTVGADYARVVTSQPRQYWPPGMLPSEVRLFNGKLGCGTCHHGFSQEKALLSMDNYRSRLCLACHNR